LKLVEKAFTIELDEDAAKEIAELGDVNLHDVNAIKEDLIAEKDVLINALLKK